MATSIPPSSGATFREYNFSATADGQIVVTHAIEDAIDGTDTLRNIERIQFAGGESLNMIVGTSATTSLTAHQAMTSSWALRAMTF